MYVVCSDWWYGGEARGWDKGFCEVARCLGGAAVSIDWLANKANVGAAREEKSAGNTALKKLLKLSCI